MNFLVMVMCFPLFFMIFLVLLLGIYTELRKHTN
jgi:hypothetical protein